MQALPMRKSSILRTVFCAGLLFHITALRAQVTDSALIDPYESVEEDSVSYFNTVSLLDKTPVQQRQISAEALQKLKKDKAFWYVNRTPQKPEAPKEQRSWLERLLLQGWFRILVWTVIIGGFAGAVIWFLIASDVRLFRRKPVFLASEEGSHSVEDIYTIPYEAEIAKAIAAQNFRLAVRLMYLQVLKNLSENGLIQYRQERTNSDYLMELHGQPFYDDFFRLTRHFEYAWYGQFVVSATAFETIRLHFDRLKKVWRS